MNGLPKFATYAVIAILALLVTLLGFQKKSLVAENTKLQLEEYYPKTGDWFPDMATRTMAGEDIRLGRSEKGRQIVLLFSTKCPHCVASVPFISEIARAAARNGVEMIGVTPETNKDDVTKFMLKHHLSFPVVSVSDRRSLGLMQFRMSPTFLVLSKNGVIEHVKVGRISSDEDAFGIVTSSLQKALPEPK